MVHDGWWIDIVWADQFADRLRQGTLYPRWLPRSFEGLGAPVFYFYPPTSFYLTAVFQLAGLSPYFALLAAFFVIIASGAVAAWYWLRGWTYRPLLGALFVLAAPYHLCDFYRRGALAETAAVALLPLVAIVLRRSAEQRRFGWLGIVYALLIMSHLPLALLTSVLLILPYGGWLIARDRGALLPVGIGLALGIGLAAIYLLPALSLQYAINVRQLWDNEYVRPENWGIWRPAHWPIPDIAIVMLVLGGVMAIGSLAMLMFQRNFWTIWTVIVATLVMGVVPGFWDLPLLRQVQFPWRGLGLVEFGFATALAATHIPMRYLLLLLAPLMFVTFLYLQPNPKSDGSFDILLTRYPDVTEYVPAGLFDYYSFPWQRPTAKSRQAPPIAYEDGVTTLRTFYFPAWQVVCPEGPVRAFPSPETKLLSYRGRNCTVRIAFTGAEKLGMAISLASLIALFGAAAWSHLRLRRPTA